jgi:branched-chain amino acid transport system substrate-binding protein
MRKWTFPGTAALALTLVAGAAQAEETVLISNVSELSGAGAAAGTNWRDGLAMAFDEINAAGGILGKTVELHNYDSHTDPQTSRALVQKVVDEDAYVLMGTVYSSSTIVNMMVAQQSGLPQFTGSEAPKITAMGNPYIFRTAFGAQKGLPKISAYMKQGLGLNKVAIAWVNSEFGKGGHDVFLAEMAKHGIEVVADVPSESGQVDFAADVVKLKESGAEAVFVYLTEEESARFLKEAEKQSLGLPLIGETTLIGQKVIDLSGGAANGAMGHVGLTPDAPVPALKEMADKFEAKFGYRPDHNAIKGYIGAYAVKCGTERVGEFDREKLAEELHGTVITTAECPGVLMNIGWDETGEVSRESFLVEVEDGKQVVKATLPPN